MTRRLTLKTTLLASAAAAALSVQAQTSDPQKIEVSGVASRDQAGISSAALRSPTPIEKTPQSVVVITRDLIDEQGARTLTEALSNVSAVRGTDVRDQFNFGLRIRGFDAGVLIDGVALPGQFTTPDSLVGVQRVDVVKGPAGTLYGGSQTAGNAGFIGGVVAVSTAAPEARSVTQASVRLGTRADRALALDLNRALSTEWSARLQAEVSSVDSETDRITHKQVAVQPSIAWRPGGDAELVVRLRHTESSGIDYSGLPRKGTIEPTSYTVPRTRILTADGLPDTTSDLDALNIQWSQRVNSTWSWNLTLAHVRAELDQRGTFALDSTTFAWPATSALDGPLYGLFGARLWNRITSTVLSPSVTGRLAFGGAQHTLVTGLDIDRTRDDAFLRFSPNFGLLGLVDITNPVYPTWAEPDTTATPDQKNRYRSTAAYVQDLVDFGSLQLLGSLRYTSAKVVDENPAFGVSNDTKQSKTLARIGAVYALSPQVSVFSGWGQGMRIPTFAVFTLPPKPELSEQTEIGLRLNGPAGLSGTLAIFDLKLKNALAADPANPGQTIQINEETSRGVDADVRWQISPAWRVLASLTRQTTKVKDTGTRFVDLPKGSARLAMHYDFGAASSVPGLGLGLGMNYHSTLPGDAANTYSTPSATVFDAQLSYRMGPATFALNVKNLTDKQYWVPSRYFGGGQVTPAAPRSIAATARVEF